jgi:hypothetical protein
MTDNITRTKECMLASPKKAFYVWPDKALQFPRGIARELGREDLTIVTPTFFGYKGRGHGLKVPIIIDPMCVLSVSKLCSIRRCNSLEEKF